MDNATAKEQEMEFMSDEEAVASINECFKESGCLNCGICDAVAVQYGKRGMCGDCADIYYVPDPNEIL